MRATSPLSWTWNSAVPSASVLPRTMVSPPEVKYRAHEPERLVAGHAGVGVDPGQVEVVLQVDEVAHHVAGGSARPAVGREVEVDQVAPAAQGVGVLARPALEIVLAPVAAERVGAAGTDGAIFLLLEVHMSVIISPQRGQVGRP